ncbi:phosphomethylpyrimidine synthase ThiC [Ammonifex thiophilus]|uniref:Phosphomethylpyrimidine synthase n=1 Tax=Ammonifex thiophilus TaxID=444093 RepID=A0A3D8P529_9THEO|nr:phosphomethylpyrimidine synthase ThiC [Ammonifex thiophilus]RDV84343.1 phosphomethylpyrimidine synthase ThiC [Ammonifex thiophilus]
MTQLEAARKGEITPAIERVAAREGLAVEKVLEGVAAGKIVIPANHNHRNLDPIGIGAGLRTKVNANLGTSPQFPDPERELHKLRVALAAGADTVMDLSTGGDLDTVRRLILTHSPVPVGTVPIYQAAVEARERHGSIVAMTADELFEVIERQAADGVDFMTVHCGVTMESVERLRRQGRVTDIVSRGGCFVLGWIIHHEEENPLYAQFDRLLDICRRYDVTLSLGDGLRPGALADATDRAQIQELIILGELVDRAREAGVQVMVEGPGHVPLDQVVLNVQLQKSLCRGAPFYVLGPLVTDVAPGYDHIVAAIGGAVAAMAGADFLCYVTPAEHLGLPTAEDVREGVIAARIAAHAADLVKGVPGAREWDLAMSRARKRLDWEEQLRLALDPEKARRLRQERNPEGMRECTMCGEFCAMRLVAGFLGFDTKVRPC